MLARGDCAMSIEPLDWVGAGCPVKHIPSISVGLVVCIKFIDVRCNGLQRQCHGKPMPRKPMPKEKHCR